MCSKNTAVQKPVRGAAACQQWGWGLHARGARGSMLSSQHSATRRGSHHREQRRHSSGACQRLAQRQSCNHRHDRSRGRTATVLLCMQASRCDGIARRFSRNCLSMAAAELGIVPRVYSVMTGMMSSPLKASLVSYHASVSLLSYCTCKDWNSVCFTA